MTLTPTHRESVDATSQTADWGPLSGLPGNPMIWILILGEMAVFGALLIDHYLG